MSRLMDELRKDPTATFELTCTLPSGNEARATIGPIMNGKLCAAVTFSREPPSKEDVALATYLMNQQVGCTPAELRECDSPEEAATVARKFMGGGKG